MNERTLHAVGAAERAPLSRDEMQQRGNELVKEAQRAAMQAISDSMIDDFIGGKPVTVPMLRRWRDRARRAAAAWQKVDRLTSELTDELDLALQAQRARRIKETSDE
ncbi:hypothetical protein [Curtobacterium sp. MCSS17_015]|uniref:hypothetical protein n=1 Tax=Curtobacterium sp. MCSS17_015 TaxID=2175666 RepID=UPI0011B71ED4|nr:hypothetical protein [Curtobacterium sp. MCSS17_015]WIB25836.1 hypothetical protein DEJ18_12370 [Curtobacterium sp. MCSS17_015]